MVRSRLILLLLLCASFNGCSQSKQTASHQVAFVDLESRQLVVGTSREEILSSGNSSGQLALAGFSKQEQCWYPLPESEGGAQTANPLQIASQDYGLVLELTPPTEELAQLPVKFPKRKRRR